MRIGYSNRFILGLDPGKTAISVIIRAEILVGFDEEYIDKAKSLPITRDVEDA